MKIRDKLLLAFGFYTLLAIIGGFFTYNELRAITKKLTLVEIADDVTNVVLEIRRHEKNFLLFKGKDSLHELKNHLGILKRNIDNIEVEIVKELGENNYEMMKKAIAEYELLVNKVTENFKSQDSIDTMRLRAREIQTFTEVFSKEERADINKRLKMSFNLLLFALTTIVLLGTIINIRLARNIATPIKRLEEVTKKIAAGDFSVRIEIKGKDEIASLGTSVNIMEDRLEDIMRAFEYAIERLHEKQTQLVETEKLATLGKFAAGVAHEINNPIAIINEKAGLMKDILEISEDIKNKEKFLNLINGISDSVNRCKTITHRILGFARKSETTYEAFDLNDAVKEVLGFLEKEILFKSIGLDINFKEDLLIIKSDRAHLQQVFLNLIKNAIDAVDDGGIITISTGIKNKNMARIIIKDNGHGMPPEILTRIFEPFFTTKEREKGTGLGLSITYGIVRNLNGNIFVESEVNKGTTFTIELPITMESPERKSI